MVCERHGRALPAGCDVALVLHPLKALPGAALVADFRGDSSKEPDHRLACSQYVTSPTRNWTVSLLGLVLLASRRAPGGGITVTAERPAPSARGGHRSLDWQSDVQRHRADTITASQPAADRRADSTRWR